MFNRRLSAFIRGPDSDTTPGPEPATLVLFGTGLAGAVGAVRRRRQANN